MPGDVVTSQYRSGRGVGWGTDPKREGRRDVGDAERIEYAGPAPATATHEERFWLLSGPDLDIVTQARTLDKAASGTIIHFQIAQPTDAKQRSIMHEMAPAFAGTFELRRITLATQLAAELAGTVAGGEQPALPTARPDGVLVTNAPTYVQRASGVA